jgi:hypothetical protein
MHRSENVEQKCPSQDDVVVSEMLLNLLEQGR